MARGGRRAGAGRPPGTAWKPAVKTLRKDAVEKATAVVNRGDDPLTVVSNWVMDTTLDPEFRLNAAACVLPYLYPRLSASSVDAKLTVTKVDTGDLLRRLDERLTKIAAPPTLDAKPEEPPLAIEVNPEPEDGD